METVAFCDIDIMESHVTRRELIVLVSLLTALSQAQLQGTFALSGETAAFPFK